MDGEILYSWPVTRGNFFFVFFSPGSAAVGVHFRRESGGNVCLCLQLTLRSTGWLKAVLFNIKSPYRVDDCRQPKVSADSTAPRVEDGSVVFTCPLIIFFQLGLITVINNHLRSALSSRHWMDGYNSLALFLSIQCATVVFNYEYKPFKVRLGWKKN